ncbi:MAG TPA: urease accessory protein UreE [Burkholderiales bacterium]|nr:urease accessory protein UreE [Burkholderiales bacterium]
MLLIQKRCAARAHYDAELALPFELRTRSRLRTALASGEEVGLFLERGATLRDGDFLEADNGCIVRVRAAPEPLMQIASPDPLLLTRAAYHLGNRHVAVEIGAGYLRFGADAVLGRMVEGLGFAVTELTAPFEPEPGAYGGGHHHHADEPHRHGVIHHYPRT